jgi:hypothetical protein
MTARAILTTLTMALLPGSLAAQEHAEHGEHGTLKRHRIGVLGGVTAVPKGSQVETSTIFAPTVGLDYDYKFSERFGVGLYSDFQLSSYVVETHEGTEVERENAFITSVVGVLEATHWLEFYAGPGIELEKSANYWLLKLGMSLAPTPDDVRGASFEAYVDIKQEYVSVGLALKVAARL